MTADRKRWAESLGRVIVDDNDIAGVRIATEFDTARHAGTDADPWTRTAIQGALDDGKTVAMPATVYSIPNAVTKNNPSGLLLYGMGQQSTILKVPNGTFSGSAVIEIGDDTADYNDVEVRDFEINGNRSGATGTFNGLRTRRINNLTVEGIYAHDTRDAGLRVIGDVTGSLRSVNAVIMRNWLHSNLQVGLQTRLMERSLYAFNHANGNLGVNDQAFDVWRGGLYFDEEYFSSIIGNTAKDNKPIPQGDGGNGIGLGGHELMVVGNICRDNDYGIYCGSNSDNGLVKASDTFGNAFGGIIVDNVSPPANQYTIVDNNSRDGIKAYGTSQWVWGNLGGVSEIAASTFRNPRRGVATILSGQSSVIVAHKLIAVPTIVTLGPKHAEVSDVIWSADATNITLTVPANVTANRDVAWYAEV